MFEKSIIRERKNRKGFAMLEIIIAIAIFGAIGFFALRALLGQQSEIMDGKTISDITRVTHENLLKYQSQSYLSNNDFANLSVANAEPFFSARVFRLDNAVIRPVDMDELAISFLPAQSGTGTPNRNYKIMYDFSDYKSAKNLSDQEVLRLENDIANFYTTIAPASRIGGAATALGAANAVVASSAPNSDGIIVIEVR